MERGRCGVEFHFDPNDCGVPFWDSPRCCLADFLSSDALIPVSLQTVQQSFASASSSSSASQEFASLLAALAAPAKPSGSADDHLLTQTRKVASIWDDDGLADDIASLSYEQALRSHSGYHASRPEQSAESVRAQISSPEARDPSRSLSVEEERGGTNVWGAPKERNLRSATITLRVSEAECAQLRQRAAEAGLTVSAYLRSCTFEAEALRTMVKETLAKLRSAPTEAKPVAAAVRSQTPGGPGRAARWFTPWRRSESAVRA